MKAKGLLLFISFVCAHAVYSFGQIDCTAASETKLVCQFPVSAATLAGTQLGSAVYTGAEQAAGPINASIATQLTQLPIPSATVGVVSLKEKGSDVGVPFENLGPVLTDRPETVGQGHIFMGFSYQHFNFNAVDGIGFGSFPVNFVLPNQSFGGSNVTVYANSTNKVGFQLDQYVGMATLGLTKSTDLSLIVPFSSVSLSVVSSNLSYFLFYPQKPQYAPVQNVSGSVTTAGSANGIGDVILNVKQVVFGQGGSRGAIAAGASFRFKSGDALNYLGSGAYGGNVYGLFEYRARLAPHLKISYQWNNGSELMSLGRTSTSSATTSNPTAPYNPRLPGGLQYAAGADLKINRHLTFAADLLGNQFVNAPTVSLSTQTLDPVPSSLPQTTNVPGTYTAETIAPSTYTTANISAGLKWSPLPHFLVYGNVLYQLNNVGMRSDPVPLFGIAYNLKTSKK